MTTAPDEHPAARRKELVRAAFTVFSRRGYRTAGVADIVREANVSHGTFYNYFDNKRHVADAVFDHCVELLTDGVVGQDRPREATSAAELATQFRAILTRLGTMIEREHGVIELLVVEAPSIDDALAARTVRLFDRFAALAAEYLDNGVRRGFLRDDLDTEVAGQGLLSLLLSVIVAAIQRPADHQELARHIDAIVDLALAGLTPSRTT